MNAMRQCDLAGLVEVDEHDQSWDVLNLKASKHPSVCELLMFPDMLKAA